MRHIALQRLARRRGWIGQLAEVLHPGVEHIVEDAAVQRLLGGEVVQQALLGHAGTGRDVIHRHALVAMAGEALLRGGQQLGLDRLALGVAGLTHPFLSRSLLPTLSKPAGPGPRCFALYAKCCTYLTIWSNSARSDSQ